MNKQILKSFIEQYPNHYLSPYIQNLIDLSINDVDMTDFDTVHEMALIARKGNYLTLEEIGSIDILLVNIIGHGWDNNQNR